MHLFHSTKIVRAISSILLINCLHCFLIALHQIKAENIATVLNRLRASVDRFDANFERTFNEYGRVESVRELLEDRVVPRFTVEEHSRVDFVVAFQQLQQRLQHFFDAKIRALRRLVDAAEKAAQKVDVDKVLGPILGTKKRCRDQMRALNASSVQNPRNWRTSGGKAPKSGVHVALDVYKCSEQVKRDFDWTGQGHIEQTMAENARNDAALMRQYIGTYSGLTRVFPGFHWDVGPEQYSMDLFDPRFRPWFTVAESAPKDVLFLLDFSGSAKGLFVHLIKTSVMAVLQTLSPNDFFTGIWYNSRRGFVLANCTDPRGDTFLPANSRNKLLFRRFLERLEERDQAVLPLALEESFAQFVQARHKKSSANNDNTDSAEEEMPQRSGGHRLVLLFTDGVEFWPTDVVQRFQHSQEAHGLPPIRVFGHSIGHGGRGAQPALGWLICQTRAGLGQAQIRSVAEVRLRARAYLAKLSEVLALAYRDDHRSAKRRPISWSPPYMDVQKGGAVVSLSMPVLGPQSAIYSDLEMSRKQFATGNLSAKLDGFIAVAGLDIAFAELARVMKLDDGEDGTMAYTFLVDNNGIVYWHPRLNTRPAGVFAVRQTMCHRISSTLLRSNTRVPFTRADELVQQQLGYVDSVPHRDLLELEPDTPLMRRFRTQLVRRQCGADMAPLEDAQRQLRCAELNGTSLMLGFVLLKRRFRVGTSRHQFQDEDQEYEIEPFELAERFRAAGFEAVERPKDGQNGANNSLAQQSVGILLSLGPIKQWELSSALSSVRPLSRFRALLRKMPSLRRADPFLVHLSALAPDSVFPSWASAWRSSASSQHSAGAFRFSDCALRPLPSRIDPRVFRSAFLQYRGTALRDKAALAAFFPRCEFESVNKFLQRTNLRQLLAPDGAADNGGANGQEESNDDQKLRVEVNDAATDDGTAGAAPTAMTLTVHRFMAVVEKAVPLVQIGVQLRANFFQQKFEFALKQNHGAGGGWQECTNKAGRKCLLISDSSMVLASSDPSDSASGAAAVVHLSNSEPELFAELVSRGFVHRIVWRDVEAQCPMAITSEQRRQLQRHQYLQQQQQQLQQAATATPSDSSSAAIHAASSMRLSALLSPLRPFVSLISAGVRCFASILGSCCCLWLLPAVGISTALDDNAAAHNDHHHHQQQHDHRHHGQLQQQQQFAAAFSAASSDCQFDDEQPDDLMEQCTVEHTKYHVHAHARGAQRRTNGRQNGGTGSDDGQSAAVWMRDTRCNRTIGLLPFARSHLFLLLIDGICANGAEGAGPTAAKEAQLRNKGNDRQHDGATSGEMLPQFMSEKQVPNCELTRASLPLERTLRPDLDYTLSHPKEFNPICSLYSAAQRHHQTHYGTYLLIFSFAISSVLFCSDAFRSVTF